jgi:hypothetical protein
VTERDVELHEAVDAALDALLGAQPDHLVEERPELRSPDAENEANAHRYRDPYLFYGLG